MTRKIEYSECPDLVKRIIDDAHPSLSVLGIKDNSLSFNASEMWKCSRWIYYDKINEEREEMKSGTLFSLQFYQHCHDYLTDVFKCAGIYAGNEVRISTDDGLIRGRIDTLIKLDGIIYPVEVKTEKYWGKELKYHYWHQLQMYLNMGSFNKGYMAMFGRAYGSLVMLEIAKDEEIYKKTLAKVNVLQKALKDKEPPKPDPDEEWQCEGKYCPYKKKCGKNGKNHKLEESKK